VKGGKMDYVVMGARAAVLVLLAYVAFWTIKDFIRKE